VGGDADFARQLLGILVEEAPERGRALAAAVEAGDLRALRGIAHKIRGSALTLRALPLAGAAESVETAASTGASARGGRGVDALAASLAAPLAALLEDTAAAARRLLDRAESEGAASSRRAS
jgi:HPt (histidine-containing phosphotransfer) domain-containing protein